MQSVILSLKRACTCDVVGLSAILSRPMTSLLEIFCPVSRQQTFSEDPNHHLIKLQRMWFEMSLAVFLSSMRSATLLLLLGINVSTNFVANGY